MTPTPQTPVDALMALVDEHAASATLVNSLEDYDPGNNLPAERKNADALRVAIEASASALAAMPADSVKMPTTEAEAELMTKVGMVWLEQHAPHKLKQQAGGVPAGWQVMHVESESWGAFIDAMDRAERKGYLPDAVVNEWLQFDYKDAPTKQPGKYDDVLQPFVALMERELHANTGKGDRPGWLQMDANTALLEVYYHLAKLQKAVRNNDGPGIQEYSADVANMTMMVLDVCGGIDAQALAATPSPSAVQPLSEAQIEEAIENTQWMAATGRLRHCAINCQMNLTPEQVKQESEDFEAYVKECDEYCIQMDVAGAFSYAWQAALLRSEWDGWQDIATAPRDGTVVLTWGRDTPKLRKFVGTSWRNSDTHQMARIQPTHWRPLPPPPAAGQKENEV